MYPRKLLSKPQRPNAPAPVTPETSIEIEARKRKEAKAAEIEKATAKAVAEVKLRPPVARQQAAPAEQKLAGRLVLPTAQQIKRYTEPYESMPRDRSRENFYGRNAQQWHEDNITIRNELLRMHKKGSSELDDHQYLASMGFSSEQEREKILENLYKKEILHTEDYAVANATADEFLSMALLRHAGWKPVKPANKDYVMGTDIRGYVDTVPYMIDAQSRVNRAGALNLGVAVGNSGLYDRLTRSPDKPLIDFLKDYQRDGNYIREDKLLHTPDDQYNPIRSGRFMADEFNNNKDYLISSDRRGDIRNVGRHTPYDRVLPQDWKLLDLQKMRQALLRKSMNQLEAMRITIPDYKDKIKLMIPSNKLSMFEDSTLQIPSELVQLMSAPGQFR